MALTHVCMWSDNGWKQITAEQAAKLHPGGTVSAHSGLFMCELCGQYVILTDGYYNKRHFKHSAYEKSKDCPERRFGTGYSFSYDSKEHDLPIRIIVSASSFRFEVGLLRAPISTLNKDFSIEIKPKGIYTLSYIFTKEKLNYDRITYLPIGEWPFEKYNLSFQNGKYELYEFWPTEIKGIDPKGTLFEKVSGQKLSYDADVEIEKEYYLLIRYQNDLESGNSIRIQKIIEWKTWTLYVVSASAFNEEAARFYLDYHCRLEEHPVSLQLVWPLFVEGNYIIKHNQSFMYILVNGNIVSFKTFPLADITILNYNISHPKLYKVFCSRKQQLISAGRTHPLQYTYVWKETLDKVGLAPDILVTDLDGTVIMPGETNNLPHHKTLRFKSIFDGEIIVYKNKHIVDKRKLSADKYIELDGVSYGLTVQVVIGLDIIWQIDYKKHHYVESKDEIKMLERITNVSGATIPAPHSLRNLLASFNRYPLVCQWIRKCIKEGIINEQSYRKLQEIYFNLDTNR